MPDPLLSPSLKVPKQPRSRKTLERIVNATLEILSAEGPGGVTVQAVVDRANSSVGSFYARFRGKDDLLEYLGEYVWRDALNRWNESIRSKAWEDMEFVELAEGAVALLADIRRSRVTQLRALDHVSKRGSAYETFVARVLASLEELLLVQRQGISHEQPEVAVRVGLNAVLGVMDGRIETVGSEEVGREVLVRESTQLLLGYLIGSAIGGGANVDFFDVWV